MKEWMDGRMDGWKNEWMEERMVEIRQTKKQYNFKTMLFPHCHTKNLINKNKPEVTS